jgi:hypothetical protein
MPMRGLMRVGDVGVGAADSFSVTYNRDRLLLLLAMRAADLRLRDDRRAQLLLRAFGSDDGAALRRIATSYITPQASNLAELSEHLSVLSRDMHDRGDVLYIPEAMEAIEQGQPLSDDSAAVVASMVNGSAFLVQPETENLLSLSNVSMAIASTNEHRFEVPGSALHNLFAAPNGAPTPGLASGA